MAQEPQYSLYRYEPLKEGDIRVLTLLPGPKDSEIKVTLEDIPIPDSTYEDEYEALSYTWGSQEEDAYIIVEGTDSTIIPVTKNLEEALFHLRQEHESRVLWIDAVSINQADAIEKSQQVLRMPDIYDQASKVIAWLGPEADNSSLAIDSLHTINEEVLADIRAWTFKSRIDGSVSRWGDDAPVSLNESQISALAKFLSRPWFCRLWVWQEVWRGAEYAVFMCGDKEITWEDFRSSFAVLCGTVWSSSPAREELEPCLHALRELCLADWFFFESALSATRRCRCTDPRDKIYAVNGLVLPDQFHDGMHPDYTKTVQEVYIDATLSHILTSKFIDIITYGSNSNNLPSLPSWVPDWTGPEAVLPFLRQAGAGTRLSASNNNSDSRSLFVRGLFVCQIQSLVPHAIDDRLDSTISPLEKEILRFISRVIPQSPQNVDDEIRALCRVLSLRELDEEFSTPRFHELVAVLTELYIYGSSKSRHRAMVYMTIRACCRGRSFFRSGDGKFGMVRSEARSEDIVIVAPGCGSALALRPIANGRYLLVGDACCDGVMNGEMFLGPLPDHFDFIFNQSNTAFPTHFFIFRNQQSGEITAEDPRLPLLPPEWHRIEGPWPSVPNFKHSTTGEIRAWVYDPRLDGEALVESQGLKLIDFELV